MEENAPKSQSTILERLKSERRQVDLKKEDVFADLDKVTEAGKKRLLGIIEQALTAQRDNNPEEDIISIVLYVYELDGLDALKLISDEVIDVKKYKPLPKKSINVIIKEYMKSNSLVEVFVGSPGIGNYVNYKDFLVELREQGLSITTRDAHTLIVTANLKLELEEEQKLTLEQ